MGLITATGRSIATPAHRRRAGRSLVQFLNADPAALINPTSGGGTLLILIDAVRLSDIVLSRHQASWLPNVRSRGFYLISLNCYTDMNFIVTIYNNTVILNPSVGEESKLAVRSIGYDIITLSILQRPNSSE